MGAVLKQHDMNRDWHLCGFISKTFDTIQWNYDVGDQELLEIITALEIWKYYLQNSPHVVMVFSDHKNLTYFKTPQKLNHQQVRWNLTLFQYNLHLMHVSGKRMAQSDALSRQSNHVPDRDEDNKKMTLLPDALFIHQIDTMTHDIIVKAMMKDDFPNRAIIALMEKRTPPIRSEL
jgi:hypothetical protein